MLYDIREKCFRNLVDCWKSIASAPITETEQQVTVLTGIDSPLYNPIFFTEKAQSIPITHANSKHSFWLDSVRNKDIDPKNLILAEPILKDVPVMSIRLDKQFPEVKLTNFNIELLTNSADLECWIKPVQIAFELDENAATLYRRALEKASDKFVHFCVKHNGVSIASASLYLGDEIAGFYNLAVLPEFRKNGIGTALHYTRLHEAKKRGYAIATLQATPMARALDAEIGFETQSELSIFQLKQ